MESNVTTIGEAANAPAPQRGIMRRVFLAAKALAPASFSKITVHVNKSGISKRLTQEQVKRSLANLVYHGHLVRKNGVYEVGTMNTFRNSNYNKSQASRGKQIKINSNHGRGKIAKKQSKTNGALGPAIDALLAEKKQCENRIADIDTAIAALGRL